MPKIILLLILTLISSLSWAVKFEAEFVATQNCPAYVSKNKLTNPQNITLTPGRRYAVIEANREQAPIWFRLQIDGVPQARWVNKDCGKLEPHPSIAKHNLASPSASCSTAGHADSYLLALSWQPAFCESKPDKPECRNRDPQQYHASRFTLHGLWPNRGDCPKTKGYYDYCGTYSQANKPKKFCDYPALKLDADTRQRLGKTMPSAAAGSCLQRHEWFKHGSCQTQWNVDEYYDVALALTEDFHSPLLRRFLDANVGKKIRSTEFFQIIDQSFGHNAHKRLQLKCRKGLLVDVYVELPATLRADASLSYLLLQAPADKHSSNCGTRFELDGIED